MGWDETGRYLLAKTRDSVNCDVGQAADCVRKLLMS